MRFPIANGAEGDPARLLVALIVTFISGWSFLAVHKAGEIAIRMGPRGAKTSFVADRLTKPDEFNGALAVIAFLFLLALAALASTAWDLVVASRSNREDAG